MDQRREKLIFQLFYITGDAIPPGNVYQIVRRFQIAAGGFVILMPGINYMEDFSIILLGENGIDLDV